MQSRTSKCIAGCKSRNGCAWFVRQARKFSGLPDGQRLFAWAECEPKAETGGVLLELIVLHGGVLRRVLPVIATELEVGSVGDFVGSTGATLVILEFTQRLPKRRQRGIAAL